MRATSLACTASSSGKRDPRELSTEQCKAIIDELQRMQVFYVNIGGGEPTVRPDFWELVDYATSHQVGVKFSTNGLRIDAEVAARLAASDYVDVQIRSTARPRRSMTRSAAQGPSTWLCALENLSDAGFADAKISVVMTRHNVAQLDDFKALADRYNATLRITRMRPSGRGADVWDDLHTHCRTSSASSTTGSSATATACSPVTPSSTCRPSRRAGQRAARPQPVRRWTRRLPHRPGRRRLRLPVRDPRELPGRQHPRRRRVQQIWRARAVHLVTRAAERRCMHLVQPLRCLPRRLHGREVLHRPADGRPRPGVRPGLRRAIARR